MRKKPMRRRDKFILAALLVLTGVSFVLYAVQEFIPWEGAAKDILFAALPRATVGALLLFLIATRGNAALLRPKWRVGDLLWSLPCLAVAVVNFPFSALASGAAYIKWPEIIPLFLFKCLSIAVMEEGFFRGLLLPYLRENGRTGKLLPAVLLSSLLFAAMHLINLAFGAGVGATFLQVGYTFLIGCMLAVLLFRTGNLYLAIFIHFLFDVGGTIVTDLGAGSFQDMTFWILTAVVGVLAAVHVVAALVRMLRGKTLPRL